MKPPTPQKVSVKLEIWVKPGEHQTLEALKEKFAGSILAVNDNGEILISVQEVSS